MLWGTAQLFAHHSFSAEFDANKRVILKGTVTKVDWRNPHIYVYLKVKDNGGGVTAMCSRLSSCSVPAE